MTARQTVLVTGSSSGFGELITRTLAAWADGASGRVTVLDLDVRDTDSVQRVVDHIEAEAGSIDVVVNNAGIASVGPTEAFDLDQVQAIFDTNVFGALRVDKAVLPGMRARRSGLLIHISSAVGRVLPGIGGPYSASKWALEGLAEGIAHQVRPFGVDVVLIEPGAFPTDALAKGVQASDADIAAAYAAARGSRPPVSYGDAPPDPQEVADAVLRVITTPAGKRPLRVVVGPLMTEGLVEFNETYERFRAALAATI